MDTLSTRYEDAKKLLTDFIRTNYELKILDPTLQHTQELENFEKVYYDAMSKAKAFLQGTNSNNVGSYSKNMLSHLKPPDLTPFSGGYEQWLNFKQMFMTLVHKTDLPNIFKLHYLKQHVIGEAAEHIKHITFDEQNYEVTLKILTERYEDQKQLEFTHIKNLLDMDDICPVKGAQLNSKQLEAIYNRVNQTLQSLQSLKIATCCWDPIIVYVITSKFDKYTLAEWENMSASKKPPTRHEVLEFLKKRQRIVESLELQTQKEKNNLQTFKKTEGRKRIPTSYAFFEHSEPKLSKQDPKKTRRFKPRQNCVYCNSNSHYLTFCINFKKLTLPDKYSIVKSNNLCKQCLKSHGEAKCFKPPCKICSGPHHDLLHNSLYKNNKIQRNNDTKGNQGNNCSEHNA